MIRIDGGRLVLRRPALFGGDDRPARLLIEQAFAIEDVRSIAVRRDIGEISIQLAPLADAKRVWRRFGASIRSGAVQEPNQAAGLDLAGPVPRLPVRIARAGQALTTFQARVLSQDQLRIGHPLLRDRAIRRRFIAVLRSVHGVSRVRRAGFRAMVVVSFDPAVLEAEHILRLIEGAWPEILNGPPLAPRPRKLVVAAGIFALSLTAQFFRPALLPWATAALVLYSLPNVVNALRDLARGRIGVSALYSAGLGFLLWTRLPFAGSVMATLFQFWPALAQRVVVESEKRLFAERGRRLAWARLDDGKGGELLVTPELLTPGSIIVVRAGDFVPADGIVHDGHAALDEDIVSGARGAVDRHPGDAVYAGSFVRDGVLTLRVTRAGRATAAAAIIRALPHGAIQGLPSSAEVERIADRNAKPALAVAAALLVATRVPRFSQVVIRPDYATAPRLSAHLSALTALADALARGALIRRPAALDLLASVEVFVFDDGADLASREVAISKISVVQRSAGTDALRWAAAALEGTDDPRAAALNRERDELGIDAATAHDRQRGAGAIRFRDEAGRLVSVASPAHALRGIDRARVSAGQRALIKRLAGDPPGDPAERPLVVTREDNVVGILQFARRGEPRFATAIRALRAQYPEARFIHISALPQEVAEASTGGLGLDATFGGLDPSDKADSLRSLGMRAAWIGNGADPGTAAVRAASTVSISLAGLGTLAQDAADIVLLRDDLEVLIGLRPIVDAHRARLKADYRTVYFANILGVAGGFLAGLGSLGVGLTSNAGSAVVFLRRWRGLAKLPAPAVRVAGARLIPAKQEIDPVSRPSRIG